MEYELHDICWEWMIGKIVVEPLNCRENGSVEASKRLLVEESE